MDIDEIIEAIQLEQVRITDHADEEADNDELDIEDVLQSVFNGEIIEQYRDEKSYPRCLIYSQYRAQLPIHSVWEYNRATGWAVLVTVYRPDPKRWLSWRKRI